MLSAKLQFVINSKLGKVIKGSYILSQKNLSKKSLIIGKSQHNH